MTPKRPAGSPRRRVTPSDFMSKYLLAAFLLLYGIEVIFHPSIPGWVLGLVALAAGALILVEGLRRA